MPIKLSKALDIWKDAQVIKMTFPEKFMGTPTGIEPLDKIGWLRTPFYGVIVAKNKAGKTAYLLSLGLAFAKAGRVVLFVSLEMTLEQMCTRAVANKSFTDMDQFNKIRATEEDWERTDLAIEEMSKYDVLFAEGLDTEEKLKKEIKIIKYNYPDREIVVIVDYIGLMRDPEVDNDYKVQTGLSRWFKSLTLPADYNPDNITPEQMLGMVGNTVSIITASQIVVAAKRANQPITADSASNTGAFGNDADYLWTINSVYDEEKKELPDRRRITVGGRFTAGGEAVVGFNRAQARYETLRLAPAKEPLIG